MTPRQQRFVEEYCLDWNATQAAIRAGYKAETANKTGPRLLVNVGVAEAIAERRSAVAERVLITEQEIIDGLRAEATRTGEGSSHSARVTAWSWLGKYRRMFEDDDRGSRTPPPVTVNINILNNARSGPVA